MKNIKDEEIWAKYCKAVPYEERIDKAILLRKVRKTYPQPSLLGTMDIVMIAQEPEGGDNTEDAHIV